jgi:uncharacterized phiE125 gp8 family phage protein
MSLRPRLVTAPDALPVSVDEAKAHLRLSHDDDDAVIGPMIQAAVAYLDGHAGVLGRCMVTQTWRQDFPAWPGDRQLRLPMPDVDADSVAITYLDGDGAEQTVSAGSFEVVEDAIGSVVVLRRGFNFPTLEDDRVAPVWVTFDAGFGEPADVPAAARHAILLIVGDMYENRENTVVGQVTVSELPLGAHMLIAPLRRSA